MIDEKAARLEAIRAANRAKAAAASNATPVEPVSAPSQPVISESQPPRTPNVQPASVAKRPVQQFDNDNFADMPSAMSPQNLVFMLIAVAAGSFAAVVLLPTWLPGLTTSLLGTEPKAYWYLARSSAFVAYGLLWLSMVFGLLMTNKLARLWPGGPVAFDLHQHTSLLGLAIALFHALILMGDRYVQAGLKEILVPFAYNGYQPTWVGLGQVSIYLFALVGLSFYLKSFIGRTGWRVIHFISFVIFLLVLVHGIWSGSDTAQPWAQQLYWSTGGSILFLTLYRILVRPRKAVTQLKGNAIQLEG